ncbi:tetratricopeptide repeat protein [Flammeovirga kamogawensis]|uniref:Tetratricopeptide repeat protein n=1 Tax=Flammeovirga kamogawensis TaxID=373891 RepID=A0ABX8GQC0_9BACT|nr:tetratricopeptide repeat protein [Flammeovirga kamogawensis]MBB6463098.1 serine phosphatase RsbU (regulator of sigma subunit) [Flammeovirga kamogawensis]QWG05731.1 tetratricopeptide repeat protein [Flammeovirga kamogawensis]TRX67559.1 tetratricopeptide repeat protein [Flammeovirga kamogawensis]
MSVSIIVLLFLFGPSDSLTTVLNDTVIIDQQLEQFYSHYKQRSDSAAYFAKEALRLSNQIKDVSRAGKSAHYLGVYYHGLNINYDSAQKYYLLATDPSRTPYELCMTYTNLGNIYHSMQYEKTAMRNLILAEKYAIQAKSKSKLSNIYTLIGSILLGTKQYDRAISYYNKAYNLALEEDKPKRQSNAINNIGIVYKDKQVFDKAIKYFKQSYLIRQEHGTPKHLLESCINIADSYLGVNKLDSASTYINLAQQLYTKNSIDSWSAELLILKANYNFKIKKYREAEKLYKEGLAVAVERKSLKDQAIVKKGLAEIYTKTNQFRKANIQLSSFLEIDEKADSIKASIEVADILLGFEVGKTEAENKALKLAAEQTDKLLLYQRTLLFISSLSLVLLIILISYLNKSFRKSKILNLELEDSLDIVKHQKAEIEKKNADLSIALEVVNVQKEQLTSTNNKLHESIRYAKGLQSSMLPSKDKLNELLGDHFIFFKPKDQVSGDFYWVYEVDNIKYVVCADCTGHGVPGAFLSVLGVASLEYIINIEGVRKPSEILYKINNRFIALLKDLSNYIQDGMDISVVAYHLDREEIEFSGARAKVYLKQNDNLNLYNTAKKAVGEEKNTSFTDTIVKVKKGDALFLSTDGYKDQFGGKKGKKLMHKNFKILLDEIAEMDTKQQYKVVRNSFNEWKGSYDQVDDVLVIGIKI